MDMGEPDPASLLWLKLPGWADDVPEDCVFYMLEETAIRHKIPLQPYDPSVKEKGRKIVLIKKNELRKKQCTACGKENDHFNFQCPNDPDRELMEQTHINGVKMVVYCEYCKKEDDHYSWKCPDQEPIPFGPSDEADLLCENCGVEDDHWTAICPKHDIPLEPEPGHRECLVCCKFEDSEHWTEDCPMLYDEDIKFCCNFLSRGDHLTVNCTKFAEPVMFCVICAARGEHETDDCPKEANDGRQYCGICDWVGDHRTEHCPLAEGLTPSKM